MTRILIALALVVSSGAGHPSRRHAPQSIGPHCLVLQAQVAELLEPPHKILLVKPETFMNLSGRCVRQAIDFYQVPLEDLARDARRFARRAIKVQDVLGEHQDAIVAGQEIRRIAAAHPHDGDHS